MAHDYGPKPEPLNRVVQAVEMALKDVPGEKLILAITGSKANKQKIRCLLIISQSREPSPVFGG
jgi:hypothetical protein